MFDVVFMFVENVPENKTNKIPKLKTLFTKQYMNVDIQRISLVAVKCRRSLGLLVMIETVNTGSRLF